MWNKIFPVVLAVAVVAMLILTFLAYSQLQSVGFAPAVIAENYLTYENYFRQFLWISSLILLILANVWLWMEGRSWALWATLLYFSFFTLLHGWWLGGVFSDYLLEKNLPKSGISFGILISTFVCMICAVGIFFDQFLVLRMRERMYKIDAPVEPSEEISIEEKPPNEEA
jgi:hypothetical protein